MGAINVAPEFGVVETRAIINVLKKNNLNELLDGFLNLSYKSKKWEKWVIDKTKISKIKCSELSGHYIFSSKEFKIIKQKASEILSKKGIDLDLIIYTSVKNAILRYLKSLNLYK